MCNHVDKSTRLKAHLGGAVCFGFRRGVPSALMMVISLLHTLGDHTLNFVPLCAQLDEPPGITKAFLAAVLAFIDSCSN